MLNLHSLNPEQRAAVERIRGPLLILAGAGTGKTRVITFRIAWMIRNKIAPDNILAVTFTNKAAREMRERVTKLIGRRKKVGDGKKSPGPTMLTFHSLGMRILRKHIDKLGYKRNFVIFDQSEQIAAIKKILSQISIKGENTDPAMVLGLLSRFRNGGSNSTEFSEPGARALAEHVQKKYQSALKACNAVDFDDLLLLTVELLENHPEVLEACRRQYRYVMVDEYQDTNAVQFKLLQLLTQEHRNLCVVGDDDQSIYGWRGAEIANLLDLEKFYPEVKVVKLEQNYRSTNTILNAANSVIRNNARRRPKELWSENGDGSKIVLHSFEDDETEARTISEEIEFARIAGRIPWKDQAILFRTNQQARALEMALRAAEIRYHLIGGQSYFDRREVKDFIAYLKMFINPHDDVSLLRIANVPSRGLSPVTMERLLAASQERECSVYAAMINPLVQTSFQTRTQRSIEAFVELIERHRAPLESTVDLHLTTWAERFLDEICYAAELRRSEKKEEAAENRIRNLKDLVSTLDRGEGKGSESTRKTPLDHLQAFLEDITLDREREEDKENKGDTVTLITTHSCKGLEFPHVYVVGIEDGLLPHARSKVEGTLDEERRLFYVAMTRAMKSLTLSYCLGRKKYGQVSPCHPSPFLQELPEDLVENAADRPSEPVSVDSGNQLFSAMRDMLGGDEEESPPED